MKFKKIVSGIVAFALTLGTFAAPAPAMAAVIENDEYTVTRLSNPDRGEREADGLVKGGDRANSYAWQMAERGDFLYIATARNVAGTLINQYAAAFAEKGINEGTLWASILSYNRKTGEFKIIYTAENAASFCTAVTFGDNVYFGTATADPAIPQTILKLDKDGNFTKVYETTGASALRASCVYDGQLFFGGTDDRESVPANADRTPAKLVILQKSGDDDAKWDRVADYRDFGETPYDSVLGGVLGAPIWEMASHNGYIYATAPGSAGFTVYRGRPAASGEAANEYGWVWEEVVGPTNGINNPGLSDTAGGEPDTMRSQAGSVFEFSGSLYAYNFDNAFAGEAEVFNGLLKIIGREGGKASDFLSYIYNSLQNPQKLWNLDDASGKFVECENLTKLTKDTTNEYIWRVSEYDGQMYVSTLDANVFYNYLTPLTGKSFVNLTQEEFERWIDYLDKLLELLQTPAMQKLLDIEGLDKVLEECKTALTKLREMEITEEKVAEFLEQYRSLPEELAAAVAKAREGINEGKLEELAEELLSTDLADRLVDGTLRLSARLLDGVDVEELIPESLQSNLTDKLVTVLKIYKKASLTYNKLGKAAKRIARKAVIAELKVIVDSVIEENYAQIEPVLTSIDWEGLDMYLAITGMVSKNEAGFDLFRTADGVNFEVVTQNGFGDKYNYGSSALLPTKEGLYIGTNNPFYGGQLYLLASKKKEETTVTLSASKLSLLVGNSAKLTATVLPEGTDTALTWKSGNTKVAKVTAAGKVSVVGVGKATVTVTTADGAKASCQVTGTAKKVYQCIKGGTAVYTTSLATAKSLKAKGYAAKLAFYAPGVSKTKVYYVHATKSGHYRYTTDKAFAKKKKQAGCKAGVAFYAAYANGTPVYELVKNGVYRYTTSKSVAKSLKSSGYTYKGIAWQAEKV